MLLFYFLPAVDFYCLKWSDEHLKFWKFSHAWKTPMAVQQRYGLEVSMSSSRYLIFTWHVAAMHDLQAKTDFMWNIYASYGSCSFPCSVLEKKRKEHWIFTVWAPLRDAHFILPCSEPLWSWKIYWSPRRGIEPRSPAWQAGILTTILSRITCLAAR